MKKGVIRGFLFLAMGAVMFGKMTLLSIVLFAAGIYSLVRSQKQEQAAFQWTGPRQHVRIPRTHAVRSRLTKLRRLHRRNSAKYPELREDYDEILEALWEELADATDPAEWVNTLDEVIRDWPTPFATDSSPLRDSMAKARVSAEAWRTAHQEAYRESVI